jgi:hypothetical protein
LEQQAGAIGILLAVAAAYVPLLQAQFIAAFMEWLWDL